MDDSNPETHHFYWVRPISLVGEADHFGGVEANHFGGVEAVHCDGVEADHCDGVEADH